MQNIRKELKNYITVNTKDIILKGLVPMILTIESDVVVLKSFNKTMRVTDIYLSQYDKEGVETNLSILDNVVNKFQLKLFNEWINRDEYVSNDNFDDTLMRYLEMSLTDEIKCKLNIDTISEYISLAVCNYSYLLNSKLENIHGQDR
ncbi:hypothetical protein [Romboutsia ilealis]|uniref:hypothetical protein n=1 Tax=Romboutsia ilealis TaxID=1115758 RepID=UPI002729BDA2|nr:hypothetical protein [Romboutsia ilealis]